MMALNLNIADVFGGVVAGNATVAALDAPDFANMVAAAGKGEQAAVPVVADPETSVPTPDVGLLPPQLEDNQPLPSLPRAQSRGVGFEGVSTTLDTNGLEASEIAPTDTKTTDIDQREAKAATSPIALSESQPPNPQVPILTPLMPTMALAVTLINESAALPDEEPISLTPTRQRAAKIVVLNDEPMASKTVEPTATRLIAPIAMSASEPLRPQLLQVEPAASLSVDNRMPAPSPMQVIDRALPTLVERMIAFTPTIIDATRDLARVGDARDMRFNVRAGALGPVAVTIERTDAGQNLRLGVETPAAVQAVRQAEPLFNDPRNGNPFVNVTVDMTASDQRGRTPRAAPALRQNHLDIPDDQSTAPALAGRYA